jgi:hypothetical protein
MLAGAIPAASTSAKSRQRRFTSSPSLTESQGYDNPSFDIAGAVASITEGDPGVESEKASHDTLG